MKYRAVGALVLGFAMAAGCGPTLRVKTDFDHAASFNRYRSFQMGEGKVIEKGTITENTIVKDRVDVAVQNGLATRGLVQAPDHADLIARFAVGVRNVKELEGVGYPMAVGLWGVYPNDYWIVDHPEGTLVLDLVDARSQKLVWRAYCVADGSGMSDPAFIQKTVNRALEHFPPAAPRA